MSLNDVSPRLRAHSFALFSVFATFGLAAGCFTGGPGGTDSDESETTGPECPIGTLDCPCTTGGGCDPGLMCTEDNICVTEEILTECGNGTVEAGEACDDANEDDTDSCTTLCQPPSCTDGIVSGDETDEDCGGSCEAGCGFAGICVSDEDCAFPNCNPDSLSCDPPTSCSHLQNNDPDLEDGVYFIDVDGTGEDDLYPAEQVFCHTNKDGGGWTLVFIASDDGMDTWTWNNRATMGDEPAAVGDVGFRSLDYMASAYHEMAFTDVLFIHQPSNVWAHYGDVGDGLVNVGSVIGATDSPQCNSNLGGNGYALVGGTLTANATMCDTDLYFNLGDHEDTQAACMDFGSPANTAAFGPVWSSNFGDGCPFDDPAEVGVGPHGPCGACPASFTSMEFPALGYAAALDLNTGTAKAGENYLQMYVR